MLKLQPRERGVTLIELMVGVSLIAIVLALAMPSFSTTLQSRQIRTSADTIRSGLSMARNEALRRNRSVSFAVASDGGWSVGCDPFDATVGTDGEVVCPATITSRAGTSSTRNAIITPKEKQSDGTTDSASSAFTGTVRFTSLGRVDTATLAAGDIADFEVTNPTGGTCALSGGEMRCLRVLVTAMGQVRMCDPAVAAGDPRAC